MVKKKSKKAATPKLKKEIQQIKEILDGEKETLKVIADAKIRAIELMVKGHSITGYDTATAMGNRKWKKGVTVEKLFTAFKKVIPKKKDYEKTALISPATLEKYILELPFERKKLDKFTERADNGIKLIAVKPDEEDDFFKQ